MGHEQKLNECGKEMVNDVEHAVSKAFKKSTKAVSGTYGEAVRYGREHYGTSTLIAMGMGLGMGLYLGGNYKKSRLAHFTGPVLAAVYGMSRGLFR